MKKMLAALCLFTSTLAMAQPQVPIGENDTVTYRVQKDSFYLIKEKNGSETWGLTVEGVPTGSKYPTQHANYTMPARACGSSGPIEVLRMDDYGAEVMSRHQTTVGGEDLQGTMAALICDWGGQVKANPDMNKNSIQSLTTYASFAKDPLWTPDAPITDGGSQATVAVLTESLKFEEIYVSVIGKIRYPVKTTEYIKFYIDKDYCREGKGILEVKSLRAAPRKEQSFDLKSPPMDIEGREFFKIATTMCEYTMKNNTFRKRIRIEDYTKPVDNGPTVLEQMYGSGSKKK